MPRGHPKRICVTTLHDKSKDITRGALKPQRWLRCGCLAAREECHFHSALNGPAHTGCPRAARAAFLPGAYGLAEASRRLGHSPVVYLIRFTYQSPSLQVAHAPLELCLHLPMMPRFGIVIVFCSAPCCRLAIFPMTCCWLKH